MKSVMIVIRLALVGLLVAVASTTATAQVTDAPANATSIIGGVSVTIENNATLVNITAFSLSASVNATASNGSSTGNSSVFSLNTTTEGVNNDETVVIPTYDSSNFTANELIKLLNVSSFASLTLEFKDLIARANVTLQSFLFNASIQYDNETITFPPSLNGSAVNVTAQFVGAVNINTSAVDDNETITFLTVQNASFSLQSVQVSSDTSSSTSSSGSRSSSAEVVGAAIETEILAPATTTTQVVSHMWEAAIASVISALGESAHLAATDQFQPAITETETATPVETVSVKASAPTIKFSTGATGSETAWAPTVAAVGAVVVVVGAALFGLQKRQRRGYNVLSPDRPLCPR